MGEEIELNEERTKRLLTALNAAVADHLRAGEPSRAKVFEVLNATAYLVASTMSGTDYDPSLIAFFHQVLADAIVDIEKAKESGLGETKQ